MRDRRLLRIGGAPRNYRGTIGSLGLAVGVTSPSVIVWGVLASSAELPGEALAGAFVGASADASLGIGAGVQVLVGGNAKSVVLQPLSVKGETGIDVAVGVTGLTLVPEQAAKSAQSNPRQGNATGA